MRILKVLFINFSFLFFSTLSPLSALPKHLDFSVGFGFGLTAMGLPSQISNAIALYESYIAGTANEVGFPLGTNFFAGVGYKFNSHFSLGFEYSFGFNMDGGRSTILMADRAPQYVVDAINDLRGTGGFTDFEINAALNEVDEVYGGMTVNNAYMKGSFWDQKFLLYFKYMPNWGEIPIGFQFGTGLKMIHANKYTAIQSKDPRDYIKANGETLDDPISWNAISIAASRPVDIPFPLMTTDGKVYMYKNQPLMDFNFKFNIHMFYLELDYATEYHYIHNLKFTLGVMIDSNTLEAILKDRR